MSVRIEMGCEGLPLAMLYRNTSSNINSSLHLTSASLIEHLEQFEVIVRSNSVAFTVAGVVFASLVLLALLLGVCLCVQKKRSTTTTLVSSSSYTCTSCCGLRRRKKVYTNSSDDTSTLVPLLVQVSSPSNRSQFHTPISQQQLTSPNRSSSPQQVKSPGRGLYQQHPYRQGQFASSSSC
jgi:hypothetical protein